MSLHRTLGLTLALAALPAIAAAQKTNYDYDKTATFTQFKTYSWKEGTPTKNELPAAGRLTGDAGAAGAAAAALASGYLTSAMNR